MMISTIKRMRTAYANSSVQVKVSLWFVVCSILQRGISLITVPIFTRLLTTEQYGYYSTYISWYSILLVFTSLSLYYGVFNNAMMKYKDDRDRYISSMQGLVTVLTGIVFIFYLAIRQWANIFLNMTTPMVLMLFAELLVTPCLQFWSAHNRFEFKYRPIVIVTLIKTLLNPVLGIILVLVSEDKALARITSIVLIEVCVCGIIAIIQYYRGKCFFSKKYWKYALLFNLPLIPHYLSGQILNQSDRIMIGHMVNQTAVAKYSVAYNIGLLMNILTNAINWSYTPWFYQKIKKKEVLEIRNVSSIVAIIMACFVVLVMFFGPEAMTILAPLEYAEAAYVIAPVAASVFLIFMYNIFANVEFYYERNKFVLYGSVFSAVLNIILNYICIRKFGYIAAAYTTLFCYIVYSALHYLFAMKVCKENKIDKTIFNRKIIFQLAVFVILASLSMNIIYKMTAVRYGIICLLLIVAIVKRKKIIQTFTGTVTIMRSKK